MRKDSVNWDEAPLARWMGTITNDGTKRVYKSAYRNYTKFTKLSSEQLLDEAIEDFRKDVRERRDVVKTRLITFYKWMTTEYQVKRRGKGQHTVQRKGMSEKMAHAYVGAIRSFYSTYDITVRLKGRQRLPRPKVQNKRMIVSNDQVRALLNHTRSLRDRAIILTLFQGGMDADTVCSITYGDVVDKLDEHPLKLDLFRSKTGTEYYSFLGQDAVNSIKAYLKMVKERGITMTRNTPLFLKLSMKAMVGEGISTNLVQNMMRKVAVRSGLVDETMNGNSQNPLSPHSMRESFGSIMINAGVPDTIVDFWLGHRIGEMAQAYKSVQYESLKEMYLQREDLLSVTEKAVDVEAIKRDVRLEVEEHNRNLQALVNGLVTENMALKEQINNNEARLTALEDLVKATPEELIARIRTANGRDQS